MKRILSIIFLGDLWPLATFIYLLGIAFLVVSALGGCVTSPDPVGSEIQWWQHKSKWPDENYSAQGGLGAGDSVGEQLRHDGKADYKP